jgi:hypothetical protein
MRKQEMSQHRAPCRRQGRMNLAGAGEVGGAAAVGADAVGEVEDLGKGRTLYWMWGRGN